MSDPGRRATPLATILTVTLLLQMAHAGPPLICRTLEVDNCPTLAWGAGAFDTIGSYAPEAVVNDTVAVLTPELPVIARMENLRRAAIYLSDHEGPARTLLESLMARALDAGAAGTPDALAWFDAGYLVQAYHQLHRRPWHVEAYGQADGVAGYAWARRALELRGDDPAMEFGAALMTIMAPGPAYERHVARASSGVKDDPLLAGNLERLAPWMSKIRPPFRKARR